MGPPPVLVLGAVILLVVSLAGCPAPPPDPNAELIARGRQLFFNETFDGNGRTCGTCHPAENNFTLSPSFIAGLPRDNPLFVAEFVPELSENFEKPRLMREFGMILENLDGFGNLDSQFVMRGIPHTQALRTSIDSPNGPRTGWSGDGAPGDGSLRSFATGAVIQHFTKTLNRVAGVDFRLPTNDELDALEAFQLSLGRQQDLTLPLPLKGTVAKRGQELFLDNDVAKCNICHSNAGANAALGGTGPNNADFNTGVEDLPDQPARLTGEFVPRDDGFGTPGDSTFNVPPLVEAAASGPFFHNNSVETIEGAVAFYDGESFNNSPSGRFLASTDPEGEGIELDATQIVEIAAFLRVLNALENARKSTELLQQCIAAISQNREEDCTQLLQDASLQLDTGIRVLTEGGLHPTAVLFFRKALKEVGDALGRSGDQNRVRKALLQLELARADMVEER
jgi:mono/diheme cytochrome c family protein